MFDMFKEYSTKKLKETQGKLKGALKNRARKDAKDFIPGVAKKSADTSHLVSSLTLFLIIVGGLNWGVVSVSKDLNLVAKVGDTISGDPNNTNKEARLYDRAIYALVGASSVYQLGMFVTNMGAKK